MKFLYTFFVLCFVLNFSTAYADNSKIPSTPAHEWSDGSYNNLVIESITTTDIPCFGGTRGSVEIQVSGATPPITYDIGVAGTVTVQDDEYTFFQSLNADNYYRTVTDSIGCMALDTFTISEPQPLQINSTPIAESAPGAGDGSIDICVQNGTSPYTVTATPNVSIMEDTLGTCNGNFEVDSLMEGTYTFTIEDANGCIANDVVVIDVGGCSDVDSSVSTSSPIVVCKDGMADEVSMENTIGGMVGVDYAYVVTDINDVVVLWNENVNSYNIDLLPPGIYRIYGFDYQGIVDDPTGGSVEDISSSADCISLSQNFVAVEVVAQPSTAVAGQNITLCGPSVVMLEADSIAIGTGTWTQVSGAPTMIADTTATTTDVSGLVSGLYEFEWSVSNGICPPSRDTVQVMIAETTIAVDGISVVNESCFIDNNGSATISVSGAMPPITYDIGVAGTVTVQDDEYTFFQSLDAGTYYLTVTDAAGCFAVDSFIIAEPDSLYILPTVTAVMGTELENGMIELCVEGGVQPYTLTSTSEITIDSIEGDCDVNYLIDSLAAGEYIFNLVDSIGCEVTETVVVAPGDCVIGIDSVEVNSHVSCFGGNDGQLTIYAAGGNGNYQYSIDNGLTFTSAPSSLSFINLTAGDYDIIVVDELGCLATYTDNSVSVTQPADILITQENATAVSAPGADDGQMDFCVNGGNDPYTATYTGTDTGISGAFNPESGACAGNFVATGLSGDTYIIEVTDDSGCTKTFELFVDDVDCTPFEVTDIIPANVACNGENTGSIEMTTSGGFAPYTFVIDNGTDTDTIFGVNDDTYLFDSLSVGSYTLTAIHSGDCAVEGMAFITESSELSADISTINPTSVGGTDGVICITPMGGAMSYTVSAGCGVPVQMPGDCGGTYHIAGVGAGECIITIVDDNGCIYSSTVEVISPSCAGFSLIGVTPEDAGCAGESDGLITIEVSGGEPLYNYSIDGGNTFTENANDLYTFENVAAGSYDIVVQDNLGCDVSFSSVTIGEPEPVSIQVETTTTCPGTNEGGIDVTPSGGTGTYIYFWNTGDTEQDLDQLAAGDYTLTVTDTKGCTDSIEINIAEYSAIIVNAGDNQIIDANDSIQLMADVSMAENYDFSWSPTAGLRDTTSLTPWASPLTSTTYTLTVISEEGCRYSDDIIVSVEPIRDAIAVPSAFTPNGDSENDELNVIVRGEYQLTSFHVFNRWGEEVFTTNDANTGWNGTYKGELQPIGTYVYVIKYTDGSGAALEKGGHVTLLR